MQFKPSWEEEMLLQRRRCEARVGIATNLLYCTWHPSHYRARRQPHFDESPPTFYKQTELVWFIVHAQTTACTSLSGCSKLLALEAASNSTRLPGGMKFQLSFTVTKLLPSNGSFIVLPLNSHTGFVYVFDSGRSPTIRYPAFFLQKSMSLRGALNMLSFCH